MRVYLAGPMTRYADSGYNYAAFNAAAAKLRMLGYEVENPAETNGGDPQHPEGRPYYLRHGIRRLLTCDAIVVLPGWQRSSGARLEVEIADELGMEFYRYAELAGEEAS